MIHSPIAPPNNGSRIGASTSRSRMSATSTAALTIMSLRKCNSSALIASDFVFETT
jgi:hypothetical protein